MKTFMGKNFLLTTDTAKELFHDYAENMPIIDYHCHINPKEIYEDRKFENITQVWLGGDHYKWRQMRSNGIDEKYITGDATDREKFQKWAETLEKAIGNPLYHWSHLELQRYFDYHGVLNGDTAEEVWNICNAKLAEDSMTVRNIIRKSNVKVICTTDDPIDSLEWHKKIAADETVDFKVYPAWRPDKAMNIEKPDFLEYVQKLACVSGIKVDSVKSLLAAIDNRMEFFDSMKCCGSDHGLHYVVRGLDEDSGRTGCRSNRGFEMRSDLRLPGLFIAHRRTVRNNNRSFRWSLHRRPARSFALRWLRGWYSWCCHPGCRRFCLHMRWTVFVRHPFRWQRKRADRPVPAVRL